MQTENQTSKIKPADRLASVSEYYFSKKLKEVAQMNAEGKDVISLGIGSPDMPPSEATIQTLCREAQNPDGHGYMPYVGIPELRRSFAAWYKKWYGVELNPNTEIQPLIGSKEGILHVTLAFVNPGEQVLVPNPGYPTYTSLSKILGAEVINYNLKEENGWMVAAFGSAIFAALTSILGKVGITGVESNLGTALRTGVVLIMAWVMVFVQSKQGQVKAVPKNELGFICLSGLATGASWLCYYKALQLGPASLVAPIDKLSILVTVLFSYIVFHERLSRKALTGLAVLVAGTLVMLV